jgi:hypothetical protein
VEVIALKTRVICVAQLVGCQTNFPDLSIMIANLTICLIRVRMTALITCTEYNERHTAP